MAQIATFEIHTTDIETAKAFYEAAFGWTMVRMEFGPAVFYAIEPGPNGVNGRIIQRHGAAPQIGAPVMGAVITAHVTDIDVCSARILAKGGIEAMAKFEIPGMGWMAYFLDPDRNVFGVFQAAGV